VNVIALAAIGGRHGCALRLPYARLVRSSAAALWLRPATVGACVQQLGKAWKWLVRHGCRW
jgi:hypothetical protein